MEERKARRKKEPRSRLDAQLIEALKSNDLERVRALLIEGANPNAEGLVQTPLAEAIQHASPEAVEALLENGADPNLTQKLMRCPPLTLAAEKGDPRVVRALLRAGAQVDTPVPRLLLQPTSPLDAPEGPRRTSWGYDLLDGLGSMGSQAVEATALHVATRLGFVPIAELLLEAGANAAIKDGEGKTALEWAKRARNTEMERLFRKRGFEEPASTPEERLLAASEADDADQIRRLLEGGADPNPKDPRKATRGWTPLMFSAQRGGIEAARRLLDAGADPSAADSGEPNAGLKFLFRHGGMQAIRMLGEPLGRPPLLLAAERGDAAMASLLLRAGARPDATDLLGFTALHLAAEAGSTELIRLLLEHGLELDAPDPEKKTPLLTAIERGHAAAARLLIEAGASLEAKNGEGLTPLMVAAQACDVETIRLLLEHGADARKKSARHGSALSLAAGATHFVELELVPPEERSRPPHVITHSEEGSKMLRPLPEQRVLLAVEALLEAGADPNAAPRDGRTPLVQATEYGHAQVARRLSEALTGAGPPGAPGSVQTNSTGRSPSPRKRPNEPDWTQSGPPEASRRTRLDAVQAPGSVQTNPTGRSRGPRKRPNEPDWTDPEGSTGSKRVPPNGGAR